MERAEVVQATDAAAQLVLWLSDDIELEDLMVLESISSLLEVAADALCKRLGQTPKR